VEDCLPAPAAAATAATQAASWEEAAVEAEVPEATKAAEEAVAAPALRLCLVHCYDVC